MKDKFYLTTSIPYVNAAPHIGHALEYVQADVLARFHRKEEETFFLTGADENALKNVQAAEAAGVPTADFVRKNTGEFERLVKALYISNNDFIKTTDRVRHWPGTQKLWQKCAENHDIYKGVYKGLYCVGCESYLTEDELKDGLCPEHKKKPEAVEEENYFFNLKRYQPALEKLIVTGELEIIPIERKNEVLNFIRRGLSDFSVSRSRARAKDWGIPVPNDLDQIQYVWFDALANYITALGYGQAEEKNFDRFWPADIHIIGKGITRFHAIYWPAMLLSAKLPLPKKIFVHGYVTVNGEKISKSTGNTVDPFTLIEKFGAEALRYYLLKVIPPTADGDFSEKHFTEVYNADLANGLGNLVARVAKMCEGLLLSRATSNRSLQLCETVGEEIKNFRFNTALAIIWQHISVLDKLINEERPWEKTAEEKTKILIQIIIGNNSLVPILEIAEALEPFLPETSQKIIGQFSGESVHADKALFPRIKI